MRPRRATGDRSDTGPRAERRQLSILFCDLVGSTELSSRLDPEELREIIATYLNRCTSCIEDAGGFVARYTGDGALAYFGYPRSREDDPECAIHAAISIREAVALLPTPGDIRLAVRSGIATGVVVVGDLIGAGPSEERLAIGETPNRAARLQAAAPPNGIFVSDATRRLAAEVFDFRDRGRLQLRGISTREATWEVIGRRIAVSRFGASMDLGSIPLVGRNRELGLILAGWRRCLAGRGETMSLIGEAGIGKSRLVHEARRAIAQTPHLWLEGGGGQIFQNTPFHPISNMVRRSFGADAALPASIFLERLERSLQSADVNAEQALPLVAEALSLATSEAYSPVTIGYQEHRSQLISFMSRWLFNTAKRRPVVMVVEDLHWVDPSTLEFLNYIARDVSQHSVFILYTARTNLTLARPPNGKIKRIRLGRLEPNETAEIVKAVARGLSNSLLETIVSRAAGIPLFAEELARLVANPAVCPSTTDIPASILGLLAAKLDQLGPATHSAQMASVFGNEFRAEWLGEIAGLDGLSLAATLKRLSAAGVIIKSPNEGASYCFRHALVREAAYETLLKSQRRVAHRRAAQIIMQASPEVASAQPEILAHHWEAAGESTLALAAWQDAGRVASGRRAYKEAEQAYERALAMLTTIAESNSRDEAELELQGALVTVLQITRGYSAAKSTVATARARALAQRGGDLKLQFDHGATAWMAASSAGDYDTAIRLADQLMPIALVEGSSQGLGYAYVIQMTSRYRMGDLVGANEAFEHGTPYFLSSAFVRRPGAIAQTYGNAGIIASLMDHPAEAERRKDLCLTLSRAGDNPYEVAFGAFMAATQTILMSRHAEAEALARESMRLSDKWEFPQFIATSRIALGRARAGLGFADEGVQLLKEGLRGMDASGSRAGRTMYFTWLAEAHLLNGALDEALDSLQQALTSNPKERFFQSDTLRVRGDVKRWLGDSEDAKRDYRSSIAVAKAMGAGLSHSRASASLRAMQQGTSVL